MSMDQNFGKPQTGNATTKKQDPMKQARDFSRDAKGQATDLADSAMDAAWIKIHATTA